MERGMGEGWKGGREVGEEEKGGGGGEVEWEKGKRRGEGQFLDAFDGDTDV